MISLPEASRDGLYSSLNLRVSMSPALVLEPPIFSSRPMWVKVRVLRRYIHMLSPTRR